MNRLITGITAGLALAMGGTAHAHPGHGLDAVLHGHGLELSAALSIAGLIALAVQVARDRGQR